MVLQRTFETRHLKDYLRSAEGIHTMFEQLGYDVYDPEALDADDLDMNEVDAAHVQAVYLINGMDFGHTIWLFEVGDTTMVRLRGLAHDVLQRPGTHTLIVTKDYREVIFAHPYRVGGTAKSHTRVNKLKIDTTNPTRHDVDTINALLARNRSPEDIYKAQDDAFNVTKVTNKFYKDYRDYFHRVQETVVAWNKGVPEFQNSDQRDKLHAFVQRLMGRLMFLYFLQRKGWLGGQQDFLTRQFKAIRQQYAGELDDKSSYFYREVLEPLFFETLNKRREGNWTPWGVEIPYLNGGLFDRDRDPDGLIILPDDLFDPNSDTGLLAFFNRYNFTIADDTPLEQDVAVDPEMLGKVFENMLEEEDRGQSGSFYTPRTIVSYMCQEALAGYLEESAAIPREETRCHFDPDDDIAFTPEQATRAASALDTLTVLDPAVGSGSFLIGMLNEIVLLRRKIAVTLDEAVTPATIAAWKEQIIRDTLYGVDIKPGAIEIAQLRLWLSLVVNQTMADAHPLPNLDYKLMAGNSLIETIDGEPILSESARAMLDRNVQVQQPGLFADAGADETRKLEDLRHEYFTASPQRRAQLQEQIKTQERRIIQTGLDDMLTHLNERIRQLEQKQQAAGGKWSQRDAKKYQKLVEKRGKLQDIKRDLWNDEASLPFFLYRLHFNDVFARKGGFDIVVANPPYVRQELIKDQKPELKASYPDVYMGTADLYVFFFARTHELLAPQGYFAFITLNKFMRANYGKKLRDYLPQQLTLHTLIDFGDLPIFDATTYPMITIASLHAPNGNKVKVLEVTELDETQSLHQAADRAFLLPQNALGEDGWQLTAPEVRALMDKLKAAGKPLGVFIEGDFFAGIKTGFNEAFIIDADTRDELIAADPKSAEVIKPYLRGRDVKRWRVNHTNSYIIFTRRGINIDEYPAIKTYLEQYRERLMPDGKKGRKTGSYEWYEIQDSVAFFEHFEQTKIVYPDIAPNCNFTLDTTYQYPDMTLFIISSNDKYLLGILNSNTCLYYLNSISSVIRGGFIRFKKQYLTQIPIPDVPEPLRQQIADLAQQCLDVAKDDPDRLPDLEAQLNQLVYQAYGLDADDIAIIEEHLGE